MVESDYKAILKYRKEKLRKKLIPHEKIKKELGL